MTLDPAAYEVRLVERSPGRSPVPTAFAVWPYALGSCMCPAGTCGGTSVTPRIATTPGPTARVVADLLDGALVHAVAVRSRSVDVDELAGAVERLLR